MDPSKRVWKWASAVLAVMCAALALANFLLTRMEKPSADDADWVNSGSRESVRQPTDRSQEAGTKHEPPQGSVNGDVKSPLQSAIQNPIRQLTDTIANSPAGIENRKSQFTSVQRPIPNPQSLIPGLIRPLGIVEQADGRVQAVIPDGEWVQLVEEGQVLADNTRVMKITAEGVELDRSRGESAVEMARAQDSKSGERREESAQAKAEAMPGLTTARLSGQNNGARRQPLRQNDDVKSPLQQPAELQDNSALPKEGSLGFVEHRDGRVQAVVADGPWVKVVPEASKVTDYAARAQSVGTDSAAIAPRQIVSAPEPGIEPQSAAGRIGASGWPLQESVEPIGIVEWPDGRAWAVVAQGDSVELLEDAVAVAGTRRLLELMPPPEGMGEEFTLEAAGPPAPPPEEEVAWLATSEGESNMRAPPDSEPNPPPEPEELARGQPEAESLAEASRPPPVFHAREDGLWEADLPGIEDVTAASIEQTTTAEHPSRELPVELEGALAGSVSARSRPHAVIHNSAASSADLQPAEPLSHTDRTRQVAPLGFVRWPDGRIQAVIALGESVALVEAGETLADGTCVLEVGPEGIVTAAAGATTHAGRLCHGGSADGEGHTKSPISHLTDFQASGSKLQSEPPIQDNRGQPRK